MMGRASAVGILAQRLLVVGTIALVGESVACANAPKSTSESSNSECRTAPSVLRVTNSGNQPADLFLWEQRSSGGFTSEFIGSVTPGKTETFTIGRGYVQTREATNASGGANQPRNRPETLRYEFFCSRADRGG
jgi:hypothetical protein